MEDAFRDKSLSVADHILHLYAQFLFSKEHEEELVGIYASQLARQRCIDPLCSHDIGCTAGKSIEEYPRVCCHFYHALIESARELK
ncbi:nuclear pore complex protein [Trifolium repens]|nr:nuclear pore complex protein [Trifolium repens]